MRTEFQSEWATHSGHYDGRGGFGQVTELFQEQFAHLSE